ncbi:MAG: DUF554 domain-containing protein [Oribacterium sp.]|nr:DUF554 domain-containing protein [Oribacterium sp.]
MPGLGTIANCAAIAAAGILGVLFGNRIKKRMQDTLMEANAVAVIFLGIGGAMAKMLSYKNGTFSTKGTLMMIGSLAIGSIIGEIIDLEDKFVTFGEWLKVKTGNARDPKFVDAFVTASLTVCIGAMAVVGAIQDGIYGDHSTLFAKAILDFVIILVMSASMGKGCGFAAIPVGIFQGLMTVLSTLLIPVLTDTAMDNLSFVGSVLIFCVGINLLFDRKIRVANLLPSLVIAVLWR